ncbi:RNA 3'-terminal phosphate cyclase [Halodesulfurarchaeum formicicum]|uniref:RNA 3'-terminal phosphate cyclase n=1 Tax=Halodesulfurarchaeum formicicum TaxID=1873524 RepID=A0A1J1ACY3_9EURY|nr:RNA 3'-terminal phosphate cyclase [Halodesulfurarchaeum formicicum]APE95624.1 RNA 3'-terminal phosphate cyclase (ATP) [Halodesulfurarchaeum formicicum]
MKRIDGREGGGQLVRLAVALAAIEGVPVRIDNVRGGRDEPGLRAQHVAALQTVGTLTDADSEGVEVGSETVVFRPGPILGGDVEIEVGTAGSIPLVFDTVLPLAMATETPFTVRATGGTDVKWSPPIGYHRFVKFPFLQRFGLAAEIDVERRGFYPRDGGLATLKVSPSDVAPINCQERGELKGVTIHSIATADLQEAEVSKRQVNGARDALESEIDVPISTRSESVQSHSTGTVVLVVAKYEHSLAGFDALGEPGWPAEDVGKAAAQELRRFHHATGAVDRHLADQLLPFLARAGGGITTPTLTDHVRSSRALLETFGYEVDVQTDSERTRISTGLT